MKILVIAGYCPRDNHSAALSHNAYVDGFVKLGHKVDLICYSEKGFQIDEEMTIPVIENKYEYDGLSLYEKLSMKNRPIVSDSTENEHNEGEDCVSLKSRIINFTKKTIRGMYGIYNPSIVWFQRSKHFKTDINYDCVVSMSYPQVSHLVANYLKKKRRVQAKKWIQLWEDPWSMDLGNADGMKKCLKPENKLLNEAEDIVYVSPITLIHQQELFPNNKNKMRWCPLASYYTAEEKDYTGYTENYYGYFGD